MLLPLKLKLFYLRCHYMSRNYLKMNSAFAQIFDRIEKGHIESSQGSS
jgi:hypothetical protein